MLRGSVLKGNFVRKTEIVYDRSKPVMALAKRKEENTFITLKTMSNCKCMSIVEKYGNKIF